MITTKEIEILLVEDDPNDAELTLAALRKHRLDDGVLLIKDGAEALDFVAKLDSSSSEDSLGRLKLMILDLKVPKVNGLEILRQVRSLERTRLLPVVILTSSAEERDIRKSYELGANSYVVKPMEFEKFTETVASLGYYWVIQNHPPFSVTVSPNRQGAAA